MPWLTREWHAGAGARDGVRSLDGRREIRGGHRCRPAGRGHPSRARGHLYRCRPRPRARLRHGRRVLPYTPRPREPVWVHRPGMARRPGRPGRPGRLLSARESTSTNQGGSTIAQPPSLTTRRPLGHLRSPLIAAPEHDNQRSRPDEEGTVHERPRGRRYSTHSTSKFPCPRTRRLRTTEGALTIGSVGRIFSAHNTGASFERVLHSPSMKKMAPRLSRSRIVCKFDG